MAVRVSRPRVVGLTGGALLLAAMASMPSVSWAVTVPTSHPGNLPGQPTSSIIIGSDMAAYRSWWANPVNARQTAWKNSIISRANQTLTLAVPADFTASMTQASIAQARAFRYIMDPNAATAANDLSSVTSVLKNYAKCVGGTNITKPEVAMSYYLAFDYVNAGINATDRSAITTRLSGSNVQGTLGNFLMPSNNQQAKRAATRGFGALLFNNDAEIDSMLSSLNSSFASNTTDDGGYTDSQNHYFNYMSHQVPEFLVAYKNHTGVNLGPNITPFVTMGAAQRHASELPQRHERAGRHRPVLAPDLRSHA